MMKFRRSKIFIAIPMVTLLIVLWWLHSRSYVEHQPALLEYRSKMDLDTRINLNKNHDLSLGVRNHTTSQHGDQPLVKNNVLNLLADSTAPRSPLQQRQDTDMRYDNPEVYNLNMNKKDDDLSLRARNYAASQRQRDAQVLLKNNAPVLHAPVPSPKLYKLLKERKLFELRIEKSIRESWWYLRSQLSSIKSQTVPSGELDSFLTETRKSVQNQQNLMREWYEEVNSISSPDSTIQPNWKYWQRNISAELHSLMQRRLNHIQNPKDCDSAQKLVCQVNPGRCGFGCQMHHVAYCFILAYASERTLILDSNGWSYNHKGWDAVFQPVTKCTSGDGSLNEWTLTSKENTVYLPQVNGLNSRPPQLPMSVPKDMVERLTSFHGFPFAWFASQFMHYLMRPSPELEKYLKTKRELLGLDSTNEPIVGIHVRRTDKKSEAPYHDLSQYMEQVEEWFEWYCLTHNMVKRRVFIATDEPSVLKEAKNTYPHYEIYSDSRISSLASKTYTRYSAESLFGVVFDIDTLSKCDYIVCTFSSTLCRLVYILMQKYHVDASNMYYSLDDVYWFAGQQAHNVKAIQDHIVSAKNKEQKLSFNAGDLFGIAGNEKNGYSVGTNTKTNKRGLIPSYKVEEHILVADFPTYHEID